MNQIEKWFSDDYNLDDYSDHGNDDTPNRGDGKVPMVKRSFWERYGNPMMQLFKDPFLGH